MALKCNHFQIIISSKVTQTIVRKFPATSQEQILQEKYIIIPMDADFKGPSIHPVVNKN